MDISDEDFVLDRIEDVQMPEWKLVAAFHQAWGNDNFRPSKAEVELARDLLKKHGQALMDELLPKAVKRLKVR